MPSISSPSPSPVHDWRAPDDTRRSTAIWLLKSSTRRRHDHRHWWRPFHHELSSCGRQATATPGFQIRSRRGACRTALIRYTLASLLPAICGPPLRLYPAWFYFSRRYCTDISCSGRRRAVERLLRLLPVTRSIGCLPGLAMHRLNSVTPNRSPGPHRRGELTGNSAPPGFRPGIRPTWRSLRTRPCRRCLRHCC